MMICSGTMIFYCSRTMVFLLFRNNDFIFIIVPLGTNHRSRTMIFFIIVHLGTNFVYCSFGNDILLSFLLERSIPTERLLYNFVSVPDVYISRFSVTIKNVTIGSQMSSLFFTFR